jgi:hypothetical protein
LQAVADFRSLEDFGSLSDRSARKQGQRSARTIPVARSRLDEETAEGAQTLQRSEHRRGSLPRMAGGDEVGVKAAGDADRRDRRPGKVRGLRRVRGGRELRIVAVGLAAGANGPGRATRPPRATGARGMAGRAATGFGLAARGGLYRLRLAVRTNSGPDGPLGARPKSLKTSQVFETSEVCTRLRQRRSPRAAAGNDRQAL